MVSVVDSERPIEELEAEVCTLAASIAAATCRFLLLVAELDRRELWAQQSCRSMAHWLSWKCGLGLVAARTHVRIGRALEHLPLIREEFAAGRLTFSKVRALTRVATTVSETELVDFAKITTAAQLEMAVRAYERTRVGAAKARQQIQTRYLSTTHNDDGTVTIVARLPREAAENVLAAVDAAEAEVPRDVSKLDSAESRRADALELVGLAFLAGSADRAPTEVVIHVDHEELAADPPSPLLERLLCDTAVRVDLGADSRAEHRKPRRRTRTVPVALRRTIEHRDQHTCRFPSCTNRRFLHVHHIVHYARGGATDDVNCVLLCPFHHRAVHEGGWRIYGDARQRTLIFLTPRGRRVREVPALRPARPLLTLPDIDRFGVTTAVGERMNLDYAVSALVDWEKPNKN